jgi:hypothetical protein
MFLRNRSVPSSRRFGWERPFVAPSNGDDRIVLTGIIQQGKDCLAFFEDTQTGKTTMAPVDTLVGRGRLTAISMDAVEYSCEGKTTRITIGSSLAGTVASLSRPMVTTATAPAGSTPASTSTAPAAADAMAGPPMPGAGMPPIAGFVMPPMPDMGVPPVAGVPATPGVGVLSAPATSAAPAAVPAAPPPTPAAAPAAAGAPTEVRDGTEARILERMRQRREQELNR